MATGLGLLLLSLGMEDGGVQGGAYHVVEGSVGPNLLPGSRNPSNVASASYYLTNRPLEPIQVEPDILLDADGADSARFGLDVGSLWSWSPGDEVVVVIEAIDGVNGWSGANYTASTDGLLTASSGDLLPSSNIREIPVLTVAKAPTSVNVSWVGLADENRNVVDYRVYRADSLAGPFAPVGRSSPQVPGGPVWFDEPRPHGTWCYRIAVNYRRDTTGGVFETTGQSAAVCATVGDAYVVSTRPASEEWEPNGSTPIVATFSVPMDAATATWIVTPSIPLQPAWTANNTVLSLNHNATLFEFCTIYTVEIVSSDSGGEPLVPGPVPNPWHFTAFCPLPSLGPANLRVLLVGPDVNLSWDPYPNATFYRVYESPNRFAPFPDSWNRIGLPSYTRFTATGDGMDCDNHFYIVRAVNLWGEGPNSTMGVVWSMSFGFSPTRTDVVWFSLPYASSFAKASDIASDLGPAKANVIGKWDPVQQRATVYYHARGKWRGTDFAITYGDGLYLGIVSTFQWRVAGTDANVTLSFALNSPTTGNLNRIGIPFTGAYTKASQIADELTSSRIVEVGWWSWAAQRAQRWFWNGTAWTGTDFAIAPGRGVHIVIVADFAWTPRPLTPYVP